MRSFPLLLAAISLAAAALAPASAGASSVRTEEVVRTIDSKGVEWPATNLVWRADPGEANQLELRFDAASRMAVLRDETAPIRAGRGCEARADGTVACAMTYEFGIAMLDGRDGDDVLRVDGIEASAGGGTGDDTLIAVGDERARFSGGDGDDTLIGGDGSDQLDGGAGADTISGGDGGDEIIDDPPAGPYSADRIDAGPGADWLWGIDRVVYERTTPVAVDLRAGFGGAPGEGDVLLGVEGVSGGSAADVLLGTDGPDSISGGRGGDDLIDGRGGDDGLASAGRGARVFGGAGDDTLRGYGTLDCGAGSDNVYEPGFPTLVKPASCERIVARYSYSARALPYHGRVLTLRLRGLLAEDGRCGAFVTLRPAGGGTPLARRFVRLPESRLRSVRLVASSALPARLRVEARPAYCSTKGPRLKPSEGWDRQVGPPSPLRFSVAVTPFG